MFLTDALSSLSGITGQLATIYSNGVEAYTSSQTRLAALDAIDSETVKTATPVVQTTTETTAKTKEMNWTVIGLVAVAILGILLVIMVFNRRRG